MVRCDICGNNITDKNDSNIFMRYGITPKVLCNKCYSSVSKAPVSKSSTKKSEQNEKYKNYLSYHISTNTLLSVILLSNIVLLALLSFFSLYFIRTNSSVSRNLFIFITITIAVMMLLLIWGWIILYFSRLLQSRLKE